MKLRLYLDTSVFSAYLDARSPERLDATRELWTRLDAFDAFASSIVAEEISYTPDPGRRAALVELYRKVGELPTSEAARQLAQSYLALGVFSEPQRIDALHVATAVLGRIDVLVSWNFRHLVNRRRRAMLAAHHSALGLPILEILSPPELTGE